jgi:hypothetical protein
MLECPGGSAEMALRRRMKDPVGCLEGDKRTPELEILEMVRSF